METQLSHRLQTVADLVPTGSRLLDVGSDHAYLPIALVEQGHIDFAIAGEVVQGPYQSALANVAASGLEEKVLVRLANGLAAFELSDGISAITICGMGGRLIADILAAGLDKLSAVDCLILQANNREDELRQWLMDNKFTITDEKIVTENDKFYEIMVVTHGQMSLSAANLRFGPYLNQEKSPVFKEKWQRELAKLQYALSQVPEQHETDRSAISQKIQAIKEAIDES